jgi:Protein of unknown function (DUF2845)
MKTLSILLLMLISCQIYAMRCGTYLIETGNLAPIVKQRCGEPLSINRYESSGYTYNSYGYRVPAGVEVIEEWIYQRSPNDFMYVLSFSDGRLKKIETQRNP